MLDGSTADERLERAVVAISGLLNLSQGILLQVVKIETAGADLDDAPVREVAVRILGIVSQRLAE